ncbi:HEAT repeat domain-containing protein [Aquisphaera insulae]|uniref:HEAT repeat domain-containing protein n=1 Tax=Aquisphaera insulae TaxID=2712864 RepID=UPI0013EDA844|nr:HEAT repeat domain-containing protein [Aquisphaera insulae]
MEQLERWLDAINRTDLSDPGRRERALDEMRAADGSAVFDRLRERLAADDPEARCAVITALVLLDARRAVEPVAAMLSDPDATVRWHACGCLHDFGDDRAVPALCTVMRDDPDPQVRGTAAYALGGIASPAAIPDLLAVLGSDNEYDELGHSPSSSAATALDDILGTDETRIRAGDHLRRLAGREPDLARLRSEAKALHERWSGGRA